MLLGLIEFLRDEQATTAIEYALLATLIAMAAIWAMWWMGVVLRVRFWQLAIALR